MGLVTGLRGTGDGGDFRLAMRPLARFLEHFSNPVASLEELEDVDNVAIVAVEVTLPEFGAREGDRLDVKVTSIGAAKSLQGGRLMLCPMQGPTKSQQEVYALASGPITLDDPASPTSGVVRQGAVLEANIIHHFVAGGSELEHALPWIESGADYITLVLDEAHASYAMSHAIAQIINEDSSPPGELSVIAVAADPKNVIVRVPAAERDAPAGFIAHVESLPLFAPETEARVKINRKTQSIVVTGDVEILPAAVAHNGLMLSTAAPVVDTGIPVEQVKSFVPMDTTRSGGTRLQDLLAALDQLQVPTKDQIEIIEELEKAGKIMGRLLIEE
jgi:flagellar P-ring protein precursor FlgI